MGTIKCPKTCKGELIRVMAFFLRNAQNSNGFNFGTFSLLKLVTCFFLEMPHLCHLHNRVRKGDISKKKYENGTFGE